VNLKIALITTPTAIMMMTMNALFEVVYFLVKNVGSSESNTNSAKSDFAVTTLGTQRILI
jgi:hypothetical protein